MKKLFALFALVFVVCAASAQDGIVTEITQWDGHPTAILDWNPDNIVYLDQIRGIWPNDIHVGELLSAQIARSRHMTEIRMARETARRHATERARAMYNGYGVGYPVYGGGAYGAYGYGYPYGYGSVGARVTIGGVTIGGTATRTPYGTAVSGGVSSRAVSAGGSTIITRKAKQADEVVEAQQVKTSTPDSGQVVKEITLEQYRNYVRRNQGK